MKIGVLKEIKNNENRVGLTPVGVAALTKAGHSVLVEKDAGLNSGYPNEAYEKAGGKLVAAEEAWKVDLVVKVKEPLPEEYHYFHEGLIIYTYLHLAANKPLTDALLKEKVTGIAYETVKNEKNQLPLLTPMSEIAGRMSIILGSQFLQSQYGGKGLLLSSVPGVRKGRVVIIGGGTVGTNAAKMAVGLGSEVTLLDINPQVLTQIDDLFAGRVTTLFSNSHNLQKAVEKADLVVGAVLIAGAKAPTLVTKEMVQQMKPGSVIVDIPIDQGGIFETSDHATTLSDPVYEKFGVLHYTVANIPGAVGKTATDALTARTLPLLLKITSNPELSNFTANPEIRTGLNTYEGKLVNQAVAESLDLPFTEITE